MVLIQIAASHNSVWLAASKEKAGWLRVIWRAIEMKLLERIFREEEGATAAEYAIMAGLIAVVIVAAVQLVGTNTNKLFASVLTEMGW